MKGVVTDTWPVSETALIIFTPGSNGGTYASTEKVPSASMKTPSLIGISSIVISMIVTETIRGASIEISDLGKPMPMIVTFEQDAPLVGMTDICGDRTVKVEVVAG